MKKLKIEETRGGANRKYPFNGIEEGDFKEIEATEKKETDNIRSAAGVYARIHKVKFVCRTQRDENGKIKGIRVYRIK